MADRTGIEWTDATWNPIVGCSILSAGCARCYAMRQAHRIEKMEAARTGRPAASHYFGTTKVVNGKPVWTGALRMAPEHIVTAPLRWRLPRLIFVDSMGDPFHERVPDAWIDRIFAVMALCPQHAFQVLTKRSGRMRAYCSDPETPDRIYDIVVDMVIEGRLAVVLIPGVDPSAAPPGPRMHLGRWPLPNVWKGVSTEDQQRANKRVADLVATPAAVRIVSAEPLLAMIDFTRIVVRPSDAPERGKPDISFDALRGTYGGAEPNRTRIDQVITGGESGRDARITPAGAFRSVRDQCAAAGTAFFHKQNGEYLASPNHLNFAEGEAWAHGFGARTRFEQHSDGHTYARVGRTAAGRHLDGVLHDAMPAAFAQVGAAGLLPSFSPPARRRHTTPKGAPT